MVLSANALGELRITNICIWIEMIEEEGTSSLSYYDIISVSLFCLSIKFQMCYYYSNENIFIICHYNCNIQNKKIFYIMFSIYTVIHIYQYI